MQKTLSQVNGCPQRDRSETEWYGGVQTFMWMCEDNIVEVPFGKEHLFEQILSPSNLSRTIKDGRAVSLIHKYLLFVSYKTDFKVRKTMTAPSSQFGIHTFNLRPMKARRVLLVAARMCATVL